MKQLQRQHSVGKRVCLTSPQGELTQSIFVDCHIDCCLSADDTNKGKQSQMASLVFDKDQRPLRNTSENWTIVLLTKVLTSHICKEIFLKQGGRADLVLDPLCLAKFTSVISKGFGLTRFLVLLSDTGWPSEGPISSSIYALLVAPSPLSSH